MSGMTEEMILGFNGKDMTGKPKEQVLRSAQERQTHPSLYQFLDQGLMRLGYAMTFPLEDTVTGSCHPGMNWI